MVRIAEQVPGFGGVFLDRDQGVVYIYLQDAAMQERAESVLADVFDPDLLENREVRVLQGDYSMTHLDAWYSKLRDVVWQVPGVMMTDLDERVNRIAIHMEPRRGGREEMEAAIASVDVPRPAVVIEVGCEGIPQWPPGSRSTPPEAFLRAIRYSLDAPPEALYGETIRMTLTLENTSDESVTFYTGVSPHNIVVTTPGGEQVWHWKCAKVFPAPLITETLDPGQTMEFTGEWEQVDNRGEPAPPGRLRGAGRIRSGLPRTAGHAAPCGGNSGEIKTALYSPTPSPSDGNHHPRRSIPSHPYLSIQAMQPPETERYCEPIAIVDTVPACW